MTSKQMALVAPKSLLVVAAILTGWPVVAVPFACWRRGYCAFAAVVVSVVSCRALPPGADASAT